MQSEPVDLLSVLRGTSDRYRMLTPGQTVVVGASGGPDSTALLHALAGLRTEWKLTLIACHVNHGFRGEEAEADAGFVRGLCDRLDIECHIESIDVPAMKKRRHLSSQQAARNARHAILRRVAAESKAGRIALAHTRDDRAETVLLNIMRGSGLDGLAGFPPVDLPLIRPLYDITRAQVERYCKLHLLKPRLDSSNLKTDYRRNRVRLELLPYMREHFNTQASEALLRLADLARDDNALLEEMAADSLAQILPTSFSIFNAPGVSSDSGGETDGLTLPAADLMALPVALRRRALRQAIARVRGDLQNVFLDTVEALLEAIETGRSASIELPATTNGTVRVTCYSGGITISKGFALESAIGWQVMLKTPGHTLLPRAGVYIDVEIGSVNELAAILTSRQQAAQSCNKTQSESGIYIAAFVWDKTDVKLPLMARSCRQGDRMRPLGLQGTKKLQDIFTDAKTPAWQRIRIPVLVEAGGTGRILAAGKWRSDETVLLFLRLPVRPEEFAAALERLKARTNSSQELLMAAIGYG